MTKQLVVAVAVAALFTSSCTTFTGMRRVASTSEIEDIAKQGQSDTEQGAASEQKPSKALGSDHNFDHGDWKAPREFDKSKLVKLAAAPDLKLIDGQLITNNDLAFDKKLEAIRNAKNEIRMVYFIYANDDSSSVINNALIERAQSGVKVKLLIDFVTNYKSLDLFQMLEKQGKGNLRTYFYNFPSAQIIRDANYMTLPCPASVAPAHDECYKSKMAKMSAMPNKNEPTAFAQMFLSGLYGKNPVAIKVALGYGAEIDPNKYKADPSKSPQQLAKEKEDMIEFAKLAADAFIGNSIIAKIKLSIAMSSQGETLNPLVNDATGRLPLRSIEKNDDHGALWDHLTDYTHHKLVAVDGQEFVLGGRNIEDSYHMKERVGSSGKYIFMDTDFWGKTAPGGIAKIESSFDTILRTSMVANLRTVQKIMPNDFIGNTVRSSAAEPSASEKAVGYCLMNKNKVGDKLGECILGALPNMPGYKDVNARIDSEVESMASSMERYQVKYVDAGKKRVQEIFDGLSAEDLKSAEFHYMENVNYKRVVKDGVESLQRIIGSRLGSESKNNKNIQAAWYHALENACRVSKKENRQVDVVFHTAYLLMPSGMIHRIAKMLNYDYRDCSRVKITFITNSPETTDLAPINLLARYQLGALFDHYMGLVQYQEYFDKENGKGRYKRFFPTIEYYEYKPVGGAGESLHTKLSLIGEDLIVGSANADVRSYYMDTNNALFVRNAHQLNKQYRDYIQELKSSGRIKNKMASFVGKTMKELRQENDYMLQESAKRWKKEASLTPERKLTILDKLDQAGQKIVYTTKKLLTFRGDFDFNNFHTENNNRYEINRELNELANDFDGTFKVF